MFARVRRGLCVHVYVCVYLRMRVFREVEYSACNGYSSHPIAIVSTAVSVTFRTAIALPWGVDRHEVCIHRLS